MENIKGRHNTPFGVFFKYTEGVERKVFKPKKSRWQQYQRRQKKYRFYKSALSNS